MSSTVYYKFKSQREPMKATFDGTGISVFDLKRDIILSNKLEPIAEQFELRLSNPDTGTVYEDDAEIIQRSRGVEARRVPLNWPNGPKSAAKYVTGNLVVNAKNYSRREEMRKPEAASLSGPPLGAAGSSAFASSGKASDEESNMMAMFQAQGEQWQRTQQEMAGKTAVYTPRTPAPGSDKPPPPGYICHRCGQKGHWISQCPTLNDPNWEVKRVRRTTGIPRSMLRTIEKPADADGGSYMVSADGEYVVAVADDRSWQDFQKLQQSAKKSQRQVPEELQDPITHELMEDPVRMPCCGKVYADASIQSSLINNDFQCPNCGTRDVYLDQLVPDQDMEEKIRAFVNAENPVDSREESPGTAALATTDAVKPESLESSEDDDDDDDYDPEGDRGRKRKRDEDKNEANRSRSNSAAKIKSSEVSPAPPPTLPAPSMLPFMPFLMPMMPPFAPMAPTAASNGIDNGTPSHSKYRDLTPDLDYGDGDGAEDAKREAHDGHSDSDGSDSFDRATRYSRTRYRRHRRRLDLAVV